MIRLLVIFILILLNGFFSMSEIAIVSFKKVRIDKYASRHAKGVATAHKLQEKQEEIHAHYIEHWRGKTPESEDEK